MQTRTLAVGAVTAAILAGGGGLAVLRELTPPQPAAGTAALAPVAVVAGMVDQHDVPVYLTGAGTVVPFNTVAVRAQIQGQIVSINFTEGQAMRAGDLLAQIDPRPYQAQIDHLTATRERNQTQLANALLTLNRYLPLFQKGFATQQLLDTQKAQVAQLQSALKADDALISAAKVQLSFTRLTSPIDGVTGIRQLDVGNIISPANANGLVVVTQVEPISLIFTLPQTVLPQVQEQLLKTREPLAVLAYSQDDKTGLEEGTLGLIHNEIVQTTGAIQLKANFPNKAHRLWPGQLVTARLLVGTRINGLTVPAAAVQQGQNGPYVYVIQADNTVAVRPVTVAQTSDGQALVDSGLQADEQIVVEGQDKLRPGAPVTILNGEAAEEAARQSAEQAPAP